MSNLRERHSLPHAQPFAWDSVYFITICAEPRGVNTLALPAVAPALWQAWCGYAERQSCSPLLFVVMPDHIHGLFRFPVEPGIGATVEAWKRLTARRYGLEWQRDFFDHRLRSDESFEEKAAYISDNPVRKGLASVASAWPYSWPCG
jgi:REP element-mobilizing transposase RayT